MKKKKVKTFKISLFSEDYRSIPTEMTGLQWLDAYHYCNDRNWSIIIDGAWYELWIEEE